MSAVIVYHDHAEDDTELEVNTRGTLGVLFVAETSGGATAVGVSLSYADVSLLHIQLGRWLEARR